MTNAITNDVVEIKPQSPIKAELRIILKAGGVEIAESNDPSLWQNVLAAITAGSARVQGASVPQGQSLKSGGPATAAASDAVARMAADIGVDATTLEGAMSPSSDAPFLHLDPHQWAKWVRNVPSRGRGAVSATALACTTAAVWFKAAGLGDLTVEQAQAVLQTVGVAGHNPTRSIKNCRWLQLQGDRVKINPARIEDAEEVARAFCEGEAPDLKE